MPRVVLDDHLLRDWLAGPDAALRKAIGRSDVATTNLWYVRLCKSAAAQGGGTLLQTWSSPEREAVIAGLIALPDGVTVIPMVQLAWRIGQLIRDHSGLSTLGAEAIAATEQLGARLLVSSRDDGPGIRAAALAIGAQYATLER